MNGLWTEKEMTVEAVIEEAPVRGEFKTSGNGMVGCVCFCFSLVVGFLLLWVWLVVGSFSTHLASLLSLYLSEPTEEQVPCCPIVLRSPTSARSKLGCAVAPAMLVLPPSFFLCELEKATIPENRTTYDDT